jgi:hypothetical protein
LKRSAAAHLESISIDVDASELLYRQLYFATPNTNMSARLLQTDYCT